MSKRRSIRSSAPAKIVTILLAFAFVLTPAVSCCLGLQNQAMAASSQMEMEDCRDHAPSDAPSNDHERTGDHRANCDGAGCEDCSYASAFDGVKSDRFVAVAPVGPDLVASVDNSETFVAPIATMITAIYPRRGPPDLAPTTPVALHTLLLI